MEIESNYCKDRTCVYQVMSYNFAIYLASAIIIIIIIIIYTEVHTKTKTGIAQTPFTGYQNKLVVSNIDAF